VILWALTLLRRSIWSIFSFFHLRILRLIHFRLWSLLIILWIDFLACFSITYCWTLSPLFIIKEWKYWCLWLSFLFHYFLIFSWKLFLWVRYTNLIRLIINVQKVSNSSSRSILVVNFFIIHILVIFTFIWVSHIFRALTIHTWIINTISFTILSKNSLRWLIFLLFNIPWRQIT
jgi:hypothetical protein